MLGGNFISVTVAGPLSPRRSHREHTGRWCCAPAEDVRLHQITGSSGLTYTSFPARHLDWHIKIDQISVRVTKINGTSTPWLRSWWLDPCFHKALESPVLSIDVCDSEFQDHALVFRRVGRTWNIFFLSLRRENRQHSYARWKLGVVFTRPRCF